MVQEVRFSHGKQAANQRLGHGNHYSRAIPPSVLGCLLKMQMSQSCPRPTESDKLDARPRTLHFASSLGDSEVCEQFGLDIVGEPVNVRRGEEGECIKGREGVASRTQS